VTPKSDLLDVDISETLLVRGRFFKRHDTQERIYMHSQIPTLHRLPIVSARLGLSRSAIYREIKLGRIHTVKIGRSVRVSEDEVCRYIKFVEEASR